MIAARRAASCVLAAAALAGCAQGADATDALEETADKLGEIRSGDIDLELVVDTNGADDAGFELHGPFALGEPDALPTMRIEYTETARDRRRTLTVVSAGDRAFVEDAGETSALPPEQVRRLREAIGELDESGGLSGLRVDEWVEDPELVAGGTSGGAAIERVTGRLDVDRALDDLVDVARPFAALGLGDLLRDAELLRRTAGSGTIEVYTGEKDRLLRRLRLEVDVGLDLPGGVRDALGAVVGGNVTLDIRIARPNRRVDVRKPSGGAP